MNKTLHLILIFTMAIAMSLNAQKRYLEPVFSEVEVSNPTPLASNYTILQWVALIAQGNPNGHTVRQPLAAQFYTPKGDTERKRPLILYIPTGNFFPFPANGSCGGTFRDSSNVEIATRLAKMGYVVAVINYRQGWLPTAADEPVRRYSLINAAYRGVQDMNTYIRYFKRSVAEFNNPHGIDTSKVTLWGQGTGGYLSLATAYLNTYPEIFNTGDPSKFILQTQIGPVPMVIEPYNGNIEATGPITRVDANYNALSSLPIGDTLCIPNHLGYNSEFALCVNMGGALGDSLWINDGEVPVISYHVTSDPFAPYNTDILNVPTATGPQPVVSVSGSYDINRIVDRFGNNEIFNTIPDGADPIGDAKSGDFLGLCSFSNTPNNSSSPWEWIVDGVAAPTAGCNNNGATSRVYIDTIIQYFAPRACVALGLNCDFETSTKDLTDADVNLTLAPNPASTEIKIEVSKSSPVRNISVMDLSGRLVNKVSNVNSNLYQLQRNGLQSGMYILKLEFDNGTLNKKIMFN